jgi:hypothetical protein
MVVVLRDDDMGQQPGTGATAGNRVIRRRRLNHRVAGPAGEFLAPMADHLEAAGDIVECLGDVLADRSQRAAAARTGARRRMNYLFAGEMLGQWPACRFLRLGRRLDHRRHRGRACGQPLGLVGLDALDRQLELGDVARQLFRRPAELGALVARQPEFQLGDLGLRHHRIARQIGNHLLQRGEVVGQVLGGHRHARIAPDPQRIGMAKPGVESICRTGCPRADGINQPAAVAKSAAACANRCPRATCPVAPS